MKEWAHTTKRIWEYTSTSSNTPVNKFRLKDTKYAITNYMITKALCLTVLDSMQDADLGFTSNKIGTHPIQSGVAMALCWAKVEVYTVTIIGQWKSHSFMKYIHKQIQQFTTNISNRMLKVEHFNHVPKDLWLRQECS